MVVGKQDASVHVSSSELIPAPVTQSTPMLRQPSSTLSDLDSMSKSDRSAQWVDEDDDKSKHIINFNISYSMWMIYFSYPHFIALRSYFIQPITLHYWDFVWIAMTRHYLFKCQTNASPSRVVTKASHFVFVPECEQTVGSSSCLLACCRSHSYPMRHSSEYKRPCRPVLSL